MSGVPRAGPRQRALMNDVGRRVRESTCARLVDGRVERGPDRLNWGRTSCGWRPPWPLSRGGTTIG